MDTVTLPKLEYQFLKDMLEILSQPYDSEQTPADAVGSIIEDIWDAPQEWPEYHEFFGQHPDPDEVRKQLSALAHKYNIQVDL